MYDYYGYGNFSPFHFFLGPIMMIAFWVFVIWGIVALVRHSSGSHNHPHGRPLDILKERYAKGEITKEQFESMKKDIQ
jgi:putative membrane protein